MNKELSSANYLHVFLKKVIIGYDCYPYKVTILEIYLQEQNSEV